VAVDDCEIGLGVALGSPGPSPTTGITSTWPTANRSASRNPLAAIKSTNEIPNPREIDESVSPALTAYVNGVGEGGTVTVAVGRRLSILASTSGVGVDACLPPPDTPCQMARMISIVIAETTTFKAK